LHGFKPDERAQFERALRQGYALFISRIAEGRNMKPEQIEPFAAGRLMSGRHAREGGLIDREGGLASALALARKRGNLPDDSPVQIWPERPSLLQALSEATGGEAESRVAPLQGLLTAASCPRHHRDRALGRRHARRCPTVHPLDSLIGPRGAPIP